MSHNEQSGVADVIIAELFDKGTGALKEKRIVQGKLEVDESYRDGKVFLKCIRINGKEVEKIWL